MAGVLQGQSLAHYDVGYYCDLVLSLGTRFHHGEGHEIGEEVECQRLECVNGCWSSGCRCADQGGHDSSCVSGKKWKEEN